MKMLGVLSGFKKSLYRNENITEVPKFRAVCVVLVNENSIRTAHHEVCTNSLYESTSIFPLTMSHAWLVANFVSTLSKLYTLMSPLR